MLSKLEIKFAQVWTSLDTGYVMTSQYKIHPDRKFLADFAHIPSKVIIDIQGGVWMKGKSGHSSGSGIISDCQKLFIAASTGHTVFLLTDSMINKENLTTIRETIDKRMNGII